MKIIAYPIKAVDYIAGRAIPILTTFLGSQVPGFISHYVQNLKGHVDEAAHHIRNLQRIADEHTHGSLEHLVQTYKESAIPAVKAIGEQSANDAERYLALKQAYTTITHSGFWEKPFMFLRNIELDIARATWENYTFNIPTTKEGIAYAASGFLAGALGYTFVTRGIPALIRHLRKKTPAAKTVLKASVLHPSAR